MRVDEQDQQAQQKIYDIGVGSYDVTVSVGPSYQSKRQESVATQLELMKILPNLAQIAGDIIVRNMDWPGSDEIADRIKTMLPPQVLAGSGQDTESRLAQVQSQFNSLMQQHELLVQHLNQANEEIRTKKVEQDGKVAIAKMEMETKLAIAEITTKAQDAKRRAEIELEVWKELHGASHERAMQAEEQSHEQDMGEQGHTQALEQGQQAADNQQIAAQNQPQEG